MPPDGPATRAWSRRDVLRLAGAAGAVAVAPSLLTACDPIPPALPPDPSLAGRSFVGGGEAELLPGAWCWFQMPRASMGPNGRLWLGSQASNTFTPIDGDIQLTGVDMATLQVAENVVLANDSQDDHVSPSVLAYGDRVHVAWALHRRVDYLEVGIHTPGTPFRSTRIRRPASLTSPGRGMSYASVHRVGTELWLLYRGEQFSWNLLTSVDGRTWKARGLVVAPPTSGQRPYLHAASAGKTLTITVSDGNPLEYPGTNVSTATIASDLTIRDAAGVVVGSVGAKAPKTTRLTRLLAGSAGAPGEADDIDCWLSDLQHVGNQPTGILTVREPWPDDGSPRIRDYRHRYVWIRRRSTGWVVEHLAFGGSEIWYPHKEDYSGLGAQDPTDPKRVVISTNVDPITGLPLPNANTDVPRFELFEGYRVGEGQWAWTQLTHDSVEDNLRPVIAAAGDHKALAWLRGTYWAWSNVATRLVVRRAVA